MAKGEQEEALALSCYALISLDQHIEYLVEELAMNAVTEAGVVELSLSQAKDLRHFSETTSNAITSLKKFHIDLGDN